MEQSRDPQAGDMDLRAYLQDLFVTQTQNIMDTMDTRFNLIDTRLNALESKQNSCCIMIQCILTIYIHYYTLVILLIILNS